jgi:hypothetical protein
MRQKEWGRAKTPVGLKEVESGMKGLYDWLENINRAMPYTSLWDPLGQIRSELKKDLFSEVHVP